MLISYDEKPSPLCDCLALSRLDDRLCTGSGTNASAPAKLETEDQKTLYALGLLLGRNIKPFALKPEELAIVKAGLTDAVTDAKPQVELETYGPKVNELAQKRPPPEPMRRRRRARSSRTMSRRRRARPRPRPEL